MFIRTETTGTPDSLKFLPGEPVLTSGAATFGSPDAAVRSPLARRVFEIAGVAAVHLDTDAVTVTKSAAADWDELRTPILMAITQHYNSGEAVLTDSADGPEGGDDRLVAEIRELIETRIKPAAAQTGGEILFRGFENGVVFLEMTGNSISVKDAVENMLRHYVPEVREVRDFRDAAPKPGMETPAAQAVLEILAEQINPAVAGHGGHISLVDVRESTAYIRLEGGCQGCGMANVTLKQGVERVILDAVPEITEVLDVTDHAGGNNPYFQPGKSGVSPV